MFSGEELRGLIDFYRGPVGRAYIDKQEDVMKKSFEISQARSQQLMLKVMGIVEELVEEAAGRAGTVEKKTAA